ncbi:molybdopterin-containing oxidoreductase family protein [Ruminococcus gauvreauii]|uniref:Molybdopterin-dependent oxidoreductase n=1 Tax=Ruminococcus gauvreauii TaxID=438033 RepID=A0ABY5VE66_9FIRM|nr:molybdopterin-dependent oxidoreductase [Ruminococcus gauvreauii]UWP58546.1 molybdopterin-dependent oxidoreductase [Ruminococcus gauvreauii]
MMLKKTICPYDCPASCGLLAETDGDRIYRMIGDPDHPATRGVICAKVRGYVKSLYHRERLLRPMKRNGRKGSGEFVPISWEEAADLIALRFGCIIKKEGPQAILPAVYSGVMSDIQRFCGHAFFNYMGASELVMSLCSSAKGEGYAQVMGKTPSLDPGELRDSDCVLVWGCNAAATRIHSMADLVNGKKQGKKIILIDTYENPTARVADEVVLIRPGTDGALALSLMQVLVEEGLADMLFLEEETVGAGELIGTLGDYTPERTEKITGIPAGRVRKLARAYAAAQAPSVLLGSGLSRHRNGAMAVRLITILPAFVGAWKYRGGGICGCMVSGGEVFRMDLIRRPDFRETPGRKININQLASALAGDIQGSPIKGLYVYGLNPANTVSNQKKLLEGLAREDLFTVVHERFMTDTARYADVLLPAAFSVEQSDVYRSYGYFTAGYAEKIVEPAGECKSNWDTFRLLAGAMGYRNSYFEKTEAEMVQKVLREAGSFLRERPADEWERIQGGGSISFPEADHQIYRTKSGKIEIVNREAEIPVPMYLQAEEDGYPLHLVSGPSVHTLNSTFGERADLRARRGVMSLLVHPEDAEMRNIRDGERVLCFNDLAEVEFQAEVTVRVKKGTVIAEGVYDIAHSLNGLTVNALHHERLSDCGAATTLNDNTVDIRPAGAAVDIPN